MSNLDYESPSVHSYIGILQNVISRMAGNSASAKTWCIALVSAILIVAADRAAPDLVWIAIAPVLVLCFLDSYYLSLERRFRRVYNDFIRKLHEDRATIEDLFVVSPTSANKAGVTEILKAFVSISVWPFYSVQVILLVAVRLWLSASHNLNI